MRELDVADPSAVTAQHELAARAAIAEQERAVVAAVGDPATILGHREATHLRAMRRIERLDRVALDPRHRAADAAERDPRAALDEVGALGVELRRHRAVEHERGRRGRVPAMHGARAVGDRDVRAVAPRGDQIGAGLAGVRGPRPDVPHPHVAIVIAGDQRGAIVGELDAADRLVALGEALARRHPLGPHPRVAVIVGGREPRAIG